MNRFKMVLIGPPLLLVILQMMSLSCANDVAVSVDGNIVTNGETKNTTFGGFCDGPSVVQGTVRHWKSNYSVGDTVELVCNDGYRLPHIKSTVVLVKCQSTGFWTDLLGVQATVVCEPIGGCSLPVIPNGFATQKSGGYMPGDRIPVQCSAGHSLSPRESPIITCQNDGTWKTDTGAMPLCKLTSCSPPMDIRDGGFKMIPGNRFGSDGTVLSGVKVIYNCRDGFKMAPDDTPVLTCQDGAWNGDLPHCRPKLVTDRCGPVPEILHARPYVDGALLTVSNRTFPNGAEVLYVCQSGYKQHGPSTVTCDRGEWSSLGAKCSHANSDCGLPPVIGNGEYNLLPRGNVLLSSDRISENSQVFYYCQNGYKMRDANLSVLVCSDGKWRGEPSECVKRTHCDAPMDIPNGNWIAPSSQNSDYRIGTRVRYRCDGSYKPIGQTEIECLASGYWSEYPPRCLIKEEYCNEPVAPSDGFFMCKPSYCDFFRVATEVHYMCNKNFEPRIGDDLVQTCLPGGQWSGERPVCLPVYLMSSATSTTYLNTSMVTVVVATSCGVLGLLVLIMVILALKRRMKPSGGQLCPPAPGDVPQLPYPTPHHHHHHTSSTDEHDRLALIAFADDNNRVMQVPLPSYEEATRNPLPGIAHFATGDGSRTSSIRSSHSRGDYRPLPSVPLNLRMSRETSAAEVHRGGGGGSDHHRNSVITTASNATRDNLSVAFGSLDTVNVSDGTSTSVTVDTYDSMASNPSIAMSQRAAAGSLESSSTNGSLANEAAPLLVPREAYRERDTHNRETAISPSNNNNTDTLRSQSSRTHSESSPIFEVPEESKDD